MVGQINDGLDRRLICFANSRELAKPNVGTAHWSGSDMAGDPNKPCDVAIPIPEGARAFGIQEFCQRFSIGRTSVYQEIGEGRLRARKIGRRTIITEDDAEDWLQRLPVIGSRGEAVS
jgi:excisionase family DNA binding protein